MTIPRCRVGICQYKLTGDDGLCDNHRKYIFMAILDKCNIESCFNYATYQQRCDKHKKENFAHELLVGSLPVRYGLFFVVDEKDKIISYHLSNDEYIDFDVYVSGNSFIGKVITPELLTLVREKIGIKNIICRLYSKGDIVKCSQPGTILLLHDVENVIIECTINYELHAGRYIGENFQYAIDMGVGEKYKVDVYKIRAAELETRYNEVQINRQLSAAELERVRRFYSSFYLPKQVRQSYVRCQEPMLYEVQ
jgi:hypothetical protein